MKEKKKRKGNRLPFKWFEYNYAVNNNNNFWPKFAS